MATTFEQRRNYIKEQLDGNPYFDYVFPQGAFYFFINVSKAFGKSNGSQTINDSVDFSTYATENFHVVTVPGIAFGANNFIRLSFAASQADLEKGMQRLIKAMNQLVETSK